MSTKPSIICFIIIIAFLFFGCHVTAKQKNKITASASSFTLHPGNENYFVIDIRQSLVTWKGSNPLGSHTGYVYISKGELMLEAGQLVGGTIEVDMNSIEDKKHQHDSKLINHLKSDDFFDVQKFPVSTIKLTKITPSNVNTIEITGELTIKSITHAINFPATIQVNNGTVEANGEVTIDRTNWGIRYASGKFYDFLADKTISDFIEFHVKIVAKK